jgi:UDP-N-acetylglucosamine diphosphorylase / glucose-1-phosphate thymidylyltransferase / UDP-N-acetylgalactosamine diphosphorylase / glucosamine-1-phosphate N-acetyltransferase / galactosamine-1-phosphate N-acetyltransferase
MNIIIADSNTDDYYPASLFNAQWELFSGAMTFRNRFTRFFARSLPEGFNISWFTHKKKAAMIASRYPQDAVNRLDNLSPGPVLLVSATAYPGEEMIHLEPGSSLIKNGIVVARYLSEVPASLSVEEDLFPVDPVVFQSGKESSLRAAMSHWELVSTNGRTIEDDVELLGIGSSCDDAVAVTGPRENVFIHPESQVEPYVVISTEKGPVIIDKGATVEAFSRIEGPAYIGQDSLVVTGASIHGGSSIGPVCRVGGEIEASVFQGFSNKYHTGFLGHSYVGQWVNMGALTTNSDLKNTYSDVSVFTPGGEKNTGSMKVGSIFGDFVKTSIGTLLNTGTVLGTGAMVIHNGDLTPSHIPPFTWYLRSREVKRTSVERFLVTARKTLTRRNRELTPQEEEYLENLIEEYA